MVLQQLFALFLLVCLAWRYQDASCVKTYTTYELVVPVDVTCPKNGPCYPTYKFDVPLNLGQIFRLTLFSLSIGFHKTITLQTQKAECEMDKVHQYYTGDYRIVHEGQYRCPTYGGVCDVRLPCDSHNFKDNPYAAGIFTDKQIINQQTSCVKRTNSMCGCALFLNSFCGYMSYGYSLTKKYSVYELFGSRCHVMGTVTDETKTEKTDVTVLKSQKIADYVYLGTAKELTPAIKSMVWYEESGTKPKICPNISKVKKPIKGTIGEFQLYKDKPYIADKIHEIDFYGTCTPTMRINREFYYKIVKQCKNVEESDVWDVQATKPRCGAKETSFILTLSSTP